jgi:hypothetical protein
MINVPLLAVVCILYYAQLYDITKMGVISF